MNILYLDTATEACTVGVWRNGSVCSRFELAPRTHTHWLLPMTESVLDESGLSFATLDGIAFNRGPGSFTGVRIAVAAAGSGIGPRGVGYVLGIVKAYTTRVGEGPFACELDDEVGEHLATVGREVGVNTGRARRCGWFDAVLVRQSVAINGIDGIALTKLDVLDGLKTLKICVGYKVDGEVLDYLPSSLKAQGAAEPVFEELEGWSESTAGVRSFKDINANAIKYVRRIEELIGAPVALLSTSPERDDTILMRDPFQG